jgi:hypothetical protein
LPGAIFGRRGRNRTPSSAMLRQRSANELHAFCTAQFRRRRRNPDARDLSDP